MQPPASQRRTVQPTAVVRAPPRAFSRLRFVLRASPLFDEAR